VVGFEKALRYGRVLNKKKSLHDSVKIVETRESIRTWLESRSREQTYGELTLLMIIMSPHSHVDQSDVTLRWISQLYLLLQQLARIVQQFWTLHPCRCSTRNPRPCRRGSQQQAPVVAYWMYRNGSLGRAERWLEKRLGGGRLYYHEGGGESSRPLLHQVLAFTCPKGLLHSATT
jgi:hypothetical protein